MENNLLNSILSAVEKRVNPLSFDTWFRPITMGGKEESTIVLQVPNETFRNWISSNYGEILEDSLEELNLQHCTIAFRIEDDVVAEAGSNGNGSYAAAHSG